MRSLRALVKAALGVGVSCAVCVVPIVTTAHAEAGVKLSWDHCSGDGHVSLRQFACDTDEGRDVIVGSFVPPIGVDSLSGNEVTLDFQVEYGTYPSWWAFRANGACRQAAMSMDFVPRTPPIQCIDMWQGQAAGGIGAYTIGGLGDPLRARLRAAIAVPGTNLRRLQADVEYFSFNLVIDHSKTVGEGACDGCATRVCIFFSALKLTQPIGVGDYVLHGLSEYPPTDRISWQGQTAFCSGGVINPVRNTTWGSVKALYR